MADIKLTAQFLVPGAVMYSEQECLGMETPSKAYDRHVLRLDYLPRPKAKELKRETVVYTTRKAKPVKQVIKMSEEAYQEMTRTPPASIKFGWGRMDKKARVEAHLEEMAKDLHATGFTYHIAED